MLHKIQQLCFIGYVTPSWSVNLRIVLYTISFSTLPGLFSLFNAFLFASNKACKCLLTFGLPLTRRKLQLFAFWRVLSLGSSFKGLHFQRKCLCDGKVFKFYTSFILENHSETKLSFFGNFLFDCDVTLVQKDPPIHIWDVPY